MLPVSIVIKSNGFPIKRVNQKNMKRDETAVVAYSRFTFLKETI